MSFMLFQNMELHLVYLNTLKKILLYKYARNINTLSVHQYIQVIKI